MANEKKTTTKRTTRLAKETSRTIEEQIARFLETGGKIQEIPRGVSGQVVTTGPRHITLGKRHAGNS